MKYLRLEIEIAIIQFSIIWKVHSFNIYDCNIPLMQWAAVIRCLLEIKDAPQNGCSAKRDANKPTIHGNWFRLTTFPPMILLITNILNRINHIIYKYIIKIKYIALQPKWNIIASRILTRMMKNIFSWNVFYSTHASFISQ